MSRLFVFGFSRQSPNINSSSPCPTMSVQLGLNCGMLGHTDFYVFYAPISRRPRCDQSTLSNLREDLRKHHQAVCRCNLDVGERIWLVEHVPIDHNTVNIDTSNCLVCDITTPLANYADLVSGKPDVIHLLIEGHSQNGTFFLSYLPTRAHAPSCHVLI